jgi:hypothetical protein
MTIKHVCAMGVYPPAGRNSATFSPPSPGLPSEDAGEVAARLAEEEREYDDARLAALASAPEDKREALGVQMEVNKSLVMTARHDAIAHPRGLPPCDRVAWRRALLVGSARRPVGIARMRGGGRRCGRRSYRAHRTRRTTRAGPSNDDGDPEPPGDLAGRRLPRPYLLGERQSRRADLTPRHLRVDEHAPVEVRA